MNEELTNKMVELKGKEEGERLDLKLIHNLATNGVELK